jgi:hypothetical protein
MGADADRVVDRGIRSEVEREETAERAAVAFEHEHGFVVDRLVLAVRP